MHQGSDNIVRWWDWRRHNLRQVTGSDTIVLRVGDGGSTLAAADTITDFTDGTDVLGMDDGHANIPISLSLRVPVAIPVILVISVGSEYLAIITGINASSINYLDFASMATGNQSFTGTNW